VAKFSTIQWRRIFIFNIFIAKSNLPADLYIMISKTTKTDKMRTLFLALAAGLLMSACEKNNDTPDQPYKPIVLDTKSASIVAANNDFGFNMLQQLNSEQITEDNLFVSPLSISQALSMAWNGASGNTATEIASVLGYSKGMTDGINQSSRTIANALLNADKSVAMSIANSIWYNQLYEIVPSFVDTCNASYNAEVKRCDFSNNDASVKAINGWVDDKTKGKIKSIVDQVTPYDALYLINAVYFKGSWVSKFEGDNTTNRPFTDINASHSLVSTMMQESTFNYASTSNCAAVELPYGNGHFSMVVMLPAENSSVNDLLASLNSEVWNNLTQSLSGRKVQIYLPKFKVECDFTLNDALKQLGMPQAFTDMAEFPNMLASTNLMISKVKHKTFVEVNEEGTEAAAVTSIGMVETSMPGGEDQTIVFEVNRPFVFAIREKDTGSILFIGKIVKL
jgi:serpin B